MSRNVSPLVLLLAGLAACAHGQAPNDPAKTFDLAVSGQGGVTATCDQAGCNGPTIQVAQTQDGLRGHLGNRAIDVTAGPNGVHGNVGSQPVDLQVTSDGDKLAASGMFAGRLSNLRMSASELEGRIGSCSYDLHAASPNDYQGQRACLGFPTPARVRIPVSITGRPPAERAALLAMLLSS